MKTITTKINNCSECPFVSHTGAFTPGGAKPCCNNEEIIKEKGHDCFKRVIPYKNESTLDNRKIPDWCPL